MINACDNYRDCHDLVPVSDDNSATRFFCKICNDQVILRKDLRGVYENREYSIAFKRDILQGDDNLLYKYHPQYLNT